MNFDKLLRCLADALAQYHDCELKPIQKRTPRKRSQGHGLKKKYDILGMTLLDEDEPSPPVSALENNLDDLGVPSKFINRCSICGELGRNARTHQETLVNGSYHWRPSE